jgi:biopolymer transport protein ExbD
MYRRKHSHSSGGDPDMTPMIDVVFQLIIFFIVTINLEQKYKEDIELEMGPNAPLVKEEKMQMVIEIDKRGWISLHGAQVNAQQLRNIVQRRYNYAGEFPVLIRADYRTLHRDVRNVMDICSEVGLWKISFAAIKERKTKRGGH